MPGPAGWPARPVAWVLTVAGHLQWQTAEGVFRSAGSGLGAVGRSRGMAPGACGLRLVSRCRLPAFDRETGWASNGASQPMHSRPSRSAASAGVKRLESVTGEVAWEAIGICTSTYDNWLLLKQIRLQQAYAGASITVIGYFSGQCLQIGVNLGRATA